MKRIFGAIPVWKLLQKCGVIIQKAFCVCNKMQKCHKAFVPSLIMMMVPVYIALKLLPSKNLGHSQRIPDQWTLSLEWSLARKSGKKISDWKNTFFLILHFLQNKWCLKCKKNLSINPFFFCSLCFAGQICQKFLVLKRLLWIWSVPVQVQV